MPGFRGHQYCILFLFLLLLSYIAISEGSRLMPKASWDQMLPKKLPSPSSAPSRGTNSVSSSFKSVKIMDQKLRPSSDDDRKV
nr:hypothetical protein DCAR_016721 [Ipomoea trifida]